MKEYILPSFSGPTHIRYEAATRLLWGESDRTGWVPDWLYVSNDKIHQLMFAMPSGGFFRHSERLPIIYGADEVFCILSGVLVLSNPETGEVHRANAGEAIFFRRDTWHHGFSYGTEPVRVLELFAPPPATGTGPEYALTKPNLTTVKYKQDQWLGRWPLSQTQAQTGFTMRVLREADTLWRLEGENQQALIGIWASTEYLTVGKIFLLPGHKSPVHSHGGDESLSLVEGTLSVHLPENRGDDWFELKPADGFYIPEGVGHQYFNFSDRPVTLIFGVAHNYLATKT